MSSLFDFDAPPDRYAVMGNPVSHSKSPFIHTEFAKETRQRMSYCAIQVDEGGLAQAIGNFQGTGGKGLNITVPFKREAWELVDARSMRATQAGAVNTISFRSDGSSYGDNTDGVGLINDIKDNHHGQIQGKRVLLLGAGGAVRGVIGPLLGEKPAEIVIANRTVDKATAIAGELKAQVPVIACSYPALDGHQFDLVINGTSASLHQVMLPLPDRILSNKCWCYDMMYGNEPTPFMRWAITHGAEKTLDGLGMLVEQAAESFYLWRNVRPDTTAVIAMLRKQI